MKRVLHLRSSAGVFGAENVIIEIAKHSKTFGYESIVGAIKIDEDPFPEFINKANESGLETIIFNSPKKFSLNSFLKFRKWVKENQIDVLHCHGYKEDLYGIFAPGNVRRIATNHLWKKLFLRGKINALLDSFFLRFYKTVVGVSDDIISDMKKYFIKNTIKISNGVDTDLFTIRDKANSILNKYNIPYDSLVLGMISSLTYEKGHRIALDAFSNIVKKHSGTRLLIVGDGKEKNSLLKKTNDLGLSDAVIFCGPQKNIHEILSALDIFLLPSLAEGLPMALLEAMASGKAVIATRVGENESVISNLENGILIPPSNSNELEIAIEYLFTEKDKIKTFGKKARETVVQKYSSIQMAQEYCKLYGG